MSHFKNTGGTWQEESRAAGPGPSLDSTTSATVTPGPLGAATIHPFKLRPFKVHSNCRIRPGHRDHAMANLVVLVRSSFDGTRWVWGFDSKVFFVLEAQDQNDRFGRFEVVSRWPR